MSDFIFTNIETDTSILSSSISKIIPNYDSRKVSVFSGGWGSLIATKGPYHGFHPLETDEYLCIVLGGPLLCWTANNFISGAGSPTAGTSAILERWLQGELSLSDDLSGPFTILIYNKVDCILHNITDLMLFIPIYSYHEKSKISLGSHIDLVAKASRINNSSNLDVASIADFILHGIVTYPYTVYSNIKQLQPAATHSYHITKKNISYTSEVYWEPVERIEFRKIDDAAIALRTGMQKYIATVTENIHEVGHFISAGEDSRAIAGLLPTSLARHSYFFVDNKNKEFRLAQRVAKIYNSRFNYVLRKHNHYIEIMQDASRLVGSGQEYTHAHTLFLADISGASKHSAVFGGYASDSLLKAMHANKCKKYSKFPFFPEKLISGQSRTQPIVSPVFNQSILNIIDHRRRLHLKRVGKFRPHSQHEWFMLWPYTMREAMPNLSVNRRLFPSYEIFTSHHVVKISASTPTTWKLNRRLFHKAMKPVLEKSKYVPHPAGHYPSFSWVPNIPIKFTFWLSGVPRKLYNRLSGNKIYKNDGPWADWNSLICFLDEEIISDRHIAILSELEIDSANYSYLNAKQKNNLLSLSYSLQSFRTL